ncbi:NADH dehydrogenase subunit 4 domain protein [Neisseria meningitidis N1568]|nr:NADH dehydrogenase subunit 4 domain protein [Neisseria meningitidis N1568]
MVSFYYSVYILVGFLLGNKVGYVFDGRSVVCLPLVFIIYNFF